MDFCFQDLAGGDVDTQEEKVREGDLSVFPLCKEKATATKQKDKRCVICCVS